MKFISTAYTIQTAISDAINLEFGIALAPSEIALDICYPKYEAHYTSSIAFAIANRLGIDPLKISEAIAQNNCHQNLEMSKQWQIKAFGKGWLNVFLSSQFLSEKLLAIDRWKFDEINDCGGIWQRLDISENLILPPSETISQYAYARCCALIRLAIRENLFDLFPEMGEDLNSVEISLLMEQFKISDYIDNYNSWGFEKTKLRYKLSKLLAESFLSFYDHCRIFGVPREVVFRRLLLIRNTQKLLLAINPLETNYRIYL